MSLKTEVFEGKPGIHFWAEYYLEGYGWVPHDVTAAEGADWSYSATADERHRYKAYFAQNLDPFRYVIQKDVDIPLVPVVFPNGHQRHGLLGTPGRVLYLQGGPDLLASGCLDDLNREGMSSVRSRKAG